MAICYFCVRIEVRVCPHSLNSTLCNIYLVASFFWLYTTANEPGLSVVRLLVRKIQNIETVSLPLANIDAV